MKNMCIDRNIIEKAQQNFIDVKGLIGKIYNENFQIVGFYTSGRNKNNVFITLTKSVIPCCNKKDLENLKFLSENRIIEIASESEEKVMNKYVDQVIGDCNELNKFINNLEKDIANCDNEMLKCIANYSSMVDIKNYMRKCKHMSGYICKFKNFLTRVKNYYGLDCRYYLTYSKEF